MEDNKLDLAIKEIDAVLNKYKLKSLPNDKAEVFLCKLFNLFPTLNNDNEMNYFNKNKALEEAKKLQKTTKDKNEQKREKDNEEYSKNLSKSLQKMGHK